MQENAERFKWSSEDASQKMNEKEKRDKLYNDMNKLNKAYDLLENDNVVNKIIRQIKLN